MDRSQEVAFEVLLAPGQVRLAFVSWAEQRARFVRQGGAEQFADITLRIEPNMEAGTFIFAVEIEPLPMASTAEFVNGVRRGVREWAWEHGLAWARVTLVRLVFHEVDSRESSFAVAAKIALDAACSQDGTLLPI